MMTNTIKSNSSATDLLILPYLYLLLLLLFFLLLVSTNCQSTPRYAPPDNITLDCGSSGRLWADLDRRYWEGDIDSHLSPHENPSGGNRSVTYEALKQPSTNKIPYFTARLSRSPFTYLFPVTSTGPKFVRLHFYPSSYPQDFSDPSKAFFSVTANRFTLLSNFSAYLLVAGADETIAKEFCVYIGDQDEKVINITFTPSNSSSDAYAFINGIEVVSMPTDLYYGTSEPTQQFTFIGNVGAQNPLDSSTAMETVHRLNVGGSYINPVGDTGMFRNWSPDDGYYNVVGALPVDQNFKPRFTKISNYTAPDQVYGTARSMGNDGRQNEGYNLTWGLPVDSGFIYMVRLHFCEFQKNITKSGDRVFKIYMANQTAEDHADVIMWSGGNGVPVYKDYAVIIANQGGGKTQNLSVALNPARESITLYSDAILNGIEVFKLSDSDGNLAGPNPDQSPQLPTPPTSMQPAKPKSKRTTFVAAICSGVLTCVIGLTILGLLISRRRRRGKDSGSNHGGPSKWDPLSYLAVKPTKTSASSLPSDMCRRFSLAEIRSATKDFDSVFIIGRGGFGDVYKGFINGGATPVAIKRLKPGSQQGAHEFMTEIEMLSQLRHVHLVSLIGYCNDEHEMILVYDYMLHGTLRDHLSHTVNPPLSWIQRLQICIGAAKGLHYLHAGAKRMIIHRDVKSTNILLDDKWVAKVSDFGLSKMNPNNMSNTHISTVVKGSFGYLDPEYYRRQQLTEKSDVYSFGVVLFEVLCARPALNKMLDKDQVSLAGWARLCYQNGTIDQIIDPNLKGVIAPKSLKKFTEIAMCCLHDEGIKRPSMSDVVWSLEFALQLQESENEVIKPPKRFEDEDAILLFNDQDEIVKSGGGHVWSSEVTTTTTSNSGMSFTSSSGEDRMSSANVFSEIMNPKAR